MTNVPIPGGTGRPAASRKGANRSSRTRFYLSVALLAAAAVAIVGLAIGESWLLLPDDRSAIIKSIAGLALTFIAVMPAFALFQYDRRSAGGAWHEPAWRPTGIGLISLAAALTVAVGWHGLRLAYLAARLWLGEA